MEAKDINKLYYSISEVSTITGLKQYVLRYWETEFTQLKPSKNRAGNRTYRSHDIDVIMGIKSLLYERKYTIKGAKQNLNRPAENTNQTPVPRKIIKLNNSLDVRTLKDLKNGLDDLIELIEEFKD